MLEEKVQALTKALEESQRATLNIMEDLNYIDFLIELATQSSRQDFFLLAPVLFDKVISDKVRVFIGDQIIMVIMRRLNDLTEEIHGFMKEVKLQNAQLLMDSVDKASKGVPVERLAVGFRNYIYGFLKLVKILTSDILTEQGKA